jgi:4-hydroxy-2-oxoglutarate aldolase
MLKLKGVIAPLPTPFNHEGEIYVAKVQYNVAKWNRVALGGYLVGASTGEGELLDIEEKRKLWSLVKDGAADSRTLIAGIAMPSVRASVAQSRVAAELGYAAVHASAPSLGDADLYFRALADASPLPLIAPGNFDHPNIISAPAGRIDDLSAHLQSGNTWGIWRFAAAAPFVAITILEAVQKREYEAANDWQLRASRAIELISTRTGVPALKHALDFNGYYGGPCRLPYPSLNRAAQIEIEEALHGLRS